MKSRFFLFSFSFKTNSFWILIYNLTVDSNSKSLTTSCRYFLSHILYFRQFLFLPFLDETRVTAGCSDGFIPLFCPLHLHERYYWAGEKLGLLDQECPFRFGTFNNRLRFYTYICFCSCFMVFWKNILYWKSVIDQWY